MPSIFVLIDLRAGIRKSKIRKEIITSSKLRHTPQKIAKYYNSIFPFVLIDAMQLVCVWYANNFYRYDVPLFPFFTLLICLGIVIIETKSILEPADEKEAKDLESIANAVSTVMAMKNQPDKLAEKITELLTKQLKS